MIYKRKDSYMKKGLHRLTVILLVSALLLGIFIIPVSAEQKIVVNVLSTTAKVVRNTTVYAGEIFSDGESVMKYLYSEDISVNEAVMAALKDSFTALAGSDFTPLVPEIIGETDDKGFVSSSIDERAQNAGSSWKDAINVAAQFYPDLTLIGYDSYDLFEKNEDFAAACAAETEGIEFVYENGDPFELCGPWGKLTTSITDTVTYTVENGELVKYIDREIDYTCESVTVIYTKADLSSSVPEIHIDKAVISFEECGQGVDMIAANADMAAYIADKKSKFQNALSKNLPNGITVEINGLDGLFTSDCYAEFEKIELKSLSYNLSDDAVFIGDIDDPGNMQLIGGSVTCVGNYTVSYIFVIVMKGNPVWVPGDVNGDGEADNKDVFALFRYLSGSEAEVVTASLDCNGDSSVDNKDVITLFRYLSGSGTISDLPYEGE